MSHYFYKKSGYMKEAKDLKSMIRVKKSHLSNYSAEDRVIYMKDLWEKITSAENEIDLKSIEDALRTYALERIKEETIEYSFGVIREVVSLDRHKSYERFGEYVKKEAERRFL
jgi:hypothetical protein